MRCITGDRRAEHLKRTQDPPQRRQVLGEIESRPTPLAAHRGSVGYSATRKAINRRIPKAHMIPDCI